MKIIITETKSWKMEVCTNGTWASNACVYATKEEAEAAGVELLTRWFVPTASRAVESDDAVNYKFNFEAFRPEAISK